MGYFLTILINNAVLCNVTPAHPAILPFAFHSSVPDGLLLVAIAVGRNSSPKRHVHNACVCRALAIQMLTHHSVHFITHQSFAFY